MTLPDSVSPLLVAPGELRVDHLRLFRPASAGAIEVLLAAPGLLGAAWPEGDAFAVDPGRPLSAAASFSYRSALLERFARQVDALPHDMTWEESITGWSDGLASGALRVFHDAHQPAFTRVICGDNESVVKQGPMTFVPTPPGQELDLVLRDELHSEARAWFMRRRERADDLSSVVQELLAASWAGALVTPEDLYYKVVGEYFSSTLDGMDSGNDDNELIDVMTEFQQAAYFQAKGILRRFGGVFLADVVGLGKTFIAMALLRHLQVNYRQRAVIVAPPQVLPAWEDLAEEFHVDLECVSFGKLDQLERYADREVLVIDESHNFRNPNTQRMERLSAWLRPGGGPATRKVILVSATPQNNRPRDVYEQLNFFPHTFNRFPIEDESLLDYFRAVERGQQSLTRLLQHVVVRRTRRFIRAAYPASKLSRRIGPGDYREEPLVFPRRVSGREQCLRYLIDAAYPGGLYNQILAALAALKLPRQSLALYIDPAHIEDSRLRNVRRSPGNLRGLLKVLLLKRVESSIEALRLTLDRMARRIDDMRDDLAQGFVRVPIPDNDEPGDDDDDGDVDVAPSEIFLAAELRADLEIDRSLIGDLRAGLERLGPQQDAKLAVLRDYLQRRPPGEHKVLIFTQFADTAEYLGRNLAEHDTLAVATGARGGALSLGRRFAPRANRVSLQPGEEIDLLVTTDVLSEGVNLQDGDTLINYDLHWNPVRLIQRAGRIDRIGSTNDEIHIASFLSETSLEVKLHLEAIVRARIDDFIRVFGEDFHVLPSEDRLVEQEIVDAYTGRALEAEAADDDMDGLSRHIERILRLRSDDPERYRAIRGMRPGRRASSVGGGPAVAAMRLGHSWRFYTRGDGALRLVDDCSGLDALYRHSSAPPEGPLDAETLAALRVLATSAREAFAPLAELIRTRRDQPALDAAERWVQEQLEAVRGQVPTIKYPLIERASTWILQGQHKNVFRKDARRWKRERLSPTSILDEMSRVLRQFPLENDGIDEHAELVGVLVPQPRSLPSSDTDVDGAAAFQHMPSATDPPGDDTPAEEGSPRFEEQSHLTTGSTTVASGVEPRSALSVPLSAQPASEFGPSVLLPTVAVSNVPGRSFLSEALHDMLHSEVPRPVEDPPSRRRRFRWR